jgi:hypothetical protein
MNFKNGKIEKKEPDFKFENGILTISDELIKKCKSSDENDKSSYSIRFKSNKY